MKDHTTMDYVKTMCHHFGTTANLARFMGVATVTVYSWRTGARNPGPIEHRLLFVLGLLLLEAPAMFAALTRPAVNKPDVTGKRPLPVLSDTMKAIMREMDEEARREAEALPVLPPVRYAPKQGKWNDAYWFDRSVSSEAAWHEGEDPAARIQVAALRRMTDEQEAQFWREARDYQNRTGRFVPEAVE